MNTDFKISGEILVPMNQVAVNLGNDWPTLAALIPDAFMGLSTEQKAQTWRDVLHATNEGEYDPHVLVRYFEEPDGLAVS